MLRRHLCMRELSKKLLELPQSAEEMDALEVFVEQVKAKVPELDL